MAKKEIKVSVIMATYNSESTLAMSLESVRKQEFPQNQIEILLIDGGSTDNTRTIAKKYGCIIIDNPRTEPVYAKYLGFLHAKGKYGMYLDSDEVIERKDCLSRRYRIFVKNLKVKTVIGSGYKCPKGYPFINNYINEFGDPFSFFIYRLSKDARFYVSEMKKRYPIVTKTRGYAIYDLHDVAVLPIIELVAMGTMVDLSYLKEKFPKIAKDPSLIPHFFYLINESGGYISVVDDDPLYHYSSENLKKYFGKITWRIKNNIHHVATLGMSGYSGREKFQPLTARLKKYLFLPYALLLLPSFIDAIWLVLTRKNSGYFLHVVLCFYTAVIILQQYLLKSIGIRPRLRSYGDGKIVDAR